MSSYVHDDSDLVLDTKKSLKIDSDKHISGLPMSNGPRYAKKKRLQTSKSNQEESQDQYEQQQQQPSEDEQPNIWDQDTYADSQKETQEEEEDFDIVELDQGELLSDGWSPVLNPVPIFITKKGYGSALVRFRKPSKNPTEFAVVLFDPIETVSSDNNKKKKKQQQQQQHHHISPSSEKLLHVRYRRSLVLFPKAMIYSIKQPDHQQEGKDNESGEQNTTGPSENDNDSEEKNNNSKNAKAQPAKEEPKRVSSSVMALLMGAKVKKVPQLQTNAHSHSPHTDTAPTNAAAVFKAVKNGEEIKTGNFSLKKAADSFDDYPDSVSAWSSPSYSMELKKGEKDHAFDWIPRLPNSKLPLDEFIILENGTVEPITLQEKKKLSIPAKGGLHQWKQSNESFCVVRLVSSYTSKEKPSRENNKSSSSVATEPQSFLHVKMSVVMKNADNILNSEKAHPSIKTTHNNTAPPVYLSCNANQRAHDTTAIEIIMNNGDTKPMSLAKVRGSNDPAIKEAVKLFIKQHPKCISMFQKVK